jgi:enamine deaminase RidA (YjgF/YER057c/UK114 family)
MNQVIQPDGWLPAKGYANGVYAHNGILFVGGQIGWNSQQIFESFDFISQMKQALQNIIEVVRSSGGQVNDIVRLTWYVTDKREYASRQREVGQAYREVMGKHFPAMTMVVVSALVEDEALLEIEATAVLSQSKL